jgi:hypothetical protein
MSEHESFLSRWSRLKRESGREGIDDDETPVDIVPSTEAGLAPAFDPATLPPIESIVADSDVRPFLAAGVPPELTRAALRSAWAADPAIRDFIGIAESQWDFNQPDAIPGFGPLAIAEYRRALEAQALAGFRVADGKGESPDQPERPAAADIDAHSWSAEELRNFAAAPADSFPDADSGGRVAEVTGGQSGIPNRASEPETTPGPGARRLHGGALPK